MQIGIRAHDLGIGSAEQLAGAAAGTGIEAIQLAPAKALVPALDYGQMTTGMARQIGGVFAAAGVRIAVLGCYINPVHPDPQVRQQELDRFAAALRLASDFGCSVVATETGSYDPAGGFHSHNRSEALFTTLIDSLGQMAAIAESCGVRIGLEAALPHMLHDLDSLQRAVCALDSDAVSVVFDPVNLLDTETLPAQRALFDRAINLFGSRIVALHAKDVIVCGQSLQRVPPGQGVLDYCYLLARLKKAGLNPPILMEETSGPALAPAIHFLKASAADCESLPL